MNILKSTSIYTHLEKILTLKTVLNVIFLQMNICKNCFSYKFNYIQLLAITAYINNNRGFRIIEKHIQ